jgi:hypothetical protein
MTKVINLDDARTPVTDEYFGGCPECGGSDFYFNIQRDHYCTCDKHKTVWYIGSNLFSAWQDESDEIWQGNKIRYSNYRSVKPIFPERVTCDRCGTEMFKTEMAKAYAHDRLCMNEDGTLTEMTPEEMQKVRRVLNQKAKTKTLDDFPDEIPF